MKRRYAGRKISDAAEHSIIARQRALAEFGLFALRSTDINDVLQEACKQVARGLNVPIAKLAVLQESGDLLLRGAVGLEEFAVVGETILPGGTKSALGYGLLERAPVISVVDEERRFDPSDLVRRSGVKVSANVVIWIDGQPFAGLEADSKKDWNVTQPDVDFLQSYANLVAGAIEKAKFTQRLNDLLREREILLNEIFHRIKNLLSNIIAISRRTVKHSSTLADFQNSFEGRVAALSRAHDLLLSAPDQPARLRDLLYLEFEAKGLKEGEQFNIAGPDITCSPRVIQALALLLFELATNAVKYGAISPAAPARARVDVNWDVVNDEIILRWRETGLELNTNVQRRGFGSELIGRLVPHMLGGKTTFNIERDGIDCIIQFPVKLDGIEQTFSHEPTEAPRQPGTSSDQIRTSGDANEAGLQVPDEEIYQRDRGAPQNPAGEGLPPQHTRN